MITDTSTKTELLAAIETAVSDMQSLLSPLSDEAANTIPYANSWTAAQLTDHVSKSMHGMGEALGKNGKPADRDPAEKAAGLRKTFLDFSTKMLSPDFIIPAEGHLAKKQVSEKLEAACELVKQQTQEANLGTVVEGLPFGPVTKLELLHFTVYHTQRHLHQLQKICDALK